MISQDLSDFINSPNTVEFVARYSEYILNYAEQTPGVIITQVLLGRYIVGYVEASQFFSLSAILGTSLISSASVVLGTLDRQNLEESGIIQVQNQPYLDLRGRGVVIGFVDTGIDYTLDVFRYEDGTSKIQYIYDQTVVGTPPEGFFTGHEYTNEQINQALASPNPLEIVPQVDESGHGTFLASLAAGREVEDYIGAAPDAEIIAVKLRRARPFYLDFYAIPPDQPNAFESSSVMIGIEYILYKARELNRPVVICLGLGTNFGSHDGFSLFEEYLSGISNLKGVCLCVAGGNESQARHHMQGRILSQGERQNIDIKAGDNAGDILVTIVNGVADRLSVSVRSPTGELVGRIPPRVGVTSDTQLILERSRIIISYFFPIEGSGGQLTVIRIINATPGIWTITVYGDIILDGTFHSWLPITGFVSETVEFLSATPYYTITIPATMIGCITCGAYNTLNNSLYNRSSWGPTRIGFTAPDLVAPGVDVGAFFPTGFGTMSGTSVAAAITAGASALMMQWGVVEGNDVSMSTYQIRAFLIRGCSRTNAITYPSPQWGYGTLNLIQTFQLMREL